MYYVIKLLSMLILNETIRVDLIVFIAIFADVATIAIAYDNAPFAKAPVEWQLPKVWVVSTVMGKHFLYFPPLVGDRDRLWPCDLLSVPMSS